AARHDRRSRRRAGRVRAAHRGRRHDPHALLHAPLDRGREHDAGGRAAHLRRHQPGGGDQARRPRLGRVDRHRDRRGALPEPARRGPPGLSGARDGRRLRARGAGPRPADRRGRGDRTGASLSPRALERARARLGDVAPGLQDRALPLRRRLPRLPRRRGRAAPHLERDPWGPVPRVNVSVKPTALSALFAPASARDGLAEARERLLPILRRAREAGATVHLDMEHDDVKDLTLELLRGLGAEFPDGPQLGCVIQAYRKDAFADLRAVVAWSERALRLPLAVRLVKGAYWDFETVVAAAEGWPVPVFEA